MKRERDNTSQHTSMASKSELDESPSSSDESNTVVALRLAARLGFAYNSTGRDKGNRNGG